MKLLVSIATRNRSTGYWLNEYLSKKKLNNTHFHISIDKDDLYSSNFLMLENINNITVNISEPKGKIEAINRSVSTYEGEWDVVLVGSDDMIPQVYGYDEIILSDMNDAIAEKKSVLWYDVCDMDRARHIPSPRGSAAFLRRAIIMMPVMTRHYYEKFGYVYHPDYQYFWCDNEFTDIARRKKAYKWIGKRIIEHMHPAWVEGVENDETYIRANQYFKKDMQTYNKRKKQNFKV